MKCEGLEAECSKFGQIRKLLLLIDTLMVWPLCPLGIQREADYCLKPSMEGGLVGVKSLPRVWDGTTDCQVRDHKRKGGKV